MTKGKRNTNRVYVKIVSVFLVLTVLAIFIVIHFAVSKVTIKIYANLANKTDAVLVEMMPETSPDITAESFLGKIITVEFETELSSPSTIKTVESDKAGGYVTIHNNYSKSQPLVATTRLLTPDNKLYRIQNGVTVPAGGNVEVWAEADEAGDQFIIDATNMIIPGLWEGLHELIYAEAKDGMSLTSLPKYVATQQDLDTTQQKLTIQAETEALNLINASLPEKLVINKDRLFLKFTELDSTNIGSTSEEIYLKQAVTAYGLVFSEEDLQNRAQEKFINELTSQEKIVKFLPSDFSYEILEINTETEKAVLDVTMTAVISTNEKMAQIDKEKLIGLDKANIETYLQSIGVEQTEIKFFPVWLRKVPKIQDHIIIE
jgi:hypothetical protein